MLRLLCRSRFSHIRSSGATMWNGFSRPLTTRNLHGFIFPVYSPACSRGRFFCPVSFAFSVGETYAPRGDERQHWAFSCCRLSYVLFFSRPPDASARPTFYPRCRQSPWHSDVISI